MKAILTKLIESDVKKIFTKQDFDAVIDNDGTHLIELLIYNSFHNLPDYLQDYNESWISEVQCLIGSGYAETAQNMADALAIKIIMYEMGI